MLFRLAPTTPSRDQIMCTAINDFHPPTGLDKFKQIPTVVFIRAARRVKLGRCFIVGVGQLQKLVGRVGLYLRPRCVLFTRGGIRNPLFLPCSVVGPFPFPTLVRLAGKRRDGDGCQG